MERPLVAIRCITYNHEPYIRDALEGFVMQKTDFPFVAVVHDDASTDGTAAIIREYAEKYPDIVKPIFETENQYSKRDGSLRKIMDDACRATGAEYIAMCEGDDYWTDSLKLQKQVDFLEARPDYGMCYARVRRLDQARGRFTDEWGGPSVSFDCLLAGNTVPTLSVLIRSAIYSRYIADIHPYDKGWLMGDYPVWLYVASVSKIKFFDEIIGVYRILPESASHYNNVSKQLNFTLSYRQISLYFAERYNSNKVKWIECNVLWISYLIKISSCGRYRKDGVELLAKIRNMKKVGFILFSLFFPRRLNVEIIKKTLIGN